MSCFSFLKPHKVCLVLASVVCVGVLGGCQTNKSWSSKPVEVDISETRFDMELTAFKIKKAMKFTQASKTGQEITFDGGFVYSYVFQRGYVYAPTRNDIRRGVENLFQNEPYDQDLQFHNATIPIGQIEYVGVIGDSKSCFYFRGHEGHAIVYRGKTASQSSLVGAYCEPGRVTEIKDVGLREFKKITYREE